MLNEGIAGNCILHDCIGPNALARFDRDVLSQTEVRFVIVLEGINDIGTSSTLGDLTANEIIAGLTQLVRRAHAKDLKVFGATLTPFEGTTIPNYFSPHRTVFGGPQLHHCFVRGLSGQSTVGEEFLHERKIGRETKAQPLRRPRATGALLRRT